MKRVTLSIFSKNHPDDAHLAYAVVSELNDETLSFFCTEKFRVDDELQVSFSVGNESYSYPVILFNLHEQISTGRIMTSLPTEENPFPSRKFYRCFARVLKASELTGSAPAPEGLSLAPEGLSLAPEALADDVPIAA